MKNWRVDYVDGNVDKQRHFATRRAAETFAAKFGTATVHDLSGTAL